MKTLIVWPSFRLLKVMAVVTFAVIAIVNTFERAQSIAIAVAEKVTTTGVVCALPVKVAPAIVGAVANTAAPVPVSSVNADRRFALDGVAKNVKTPVPAPVSPVDTGSPVQLARVPLAGVPSTGATKVLFVSVCVPSVVTTVPVVPVDVAAENTSAPVLSFTRML